MNNKAKVFGQCVAVVSAISISGCLVVQSQNKVSEEKPNFIATSKSAPLDEARLQKILLDQNQHKYSLIVGDKETKVSQLSDKEIKELITKVYSERSQKKFLASSKSKVFRPISSYVLKNATKTINLLTIPESEWTKLKTTIFGLSHKQEVYILAGDKKHLVTKDNTKEIEALFSKAQALTNQRNMFLSTSKSGIISPPTKQEKKFLVLSKLGVEHKFPMWDINGATIKQFKDAIAKYRKGEEVEMKTITVREDFINSSKSLDFDEVILPNFSNQEK